MDLAYDEAGSGLPLVFSHAALADRRMWDHQFAELSRSYRVVRYDWRGYGESPDPVGVFSHPRDLLGVLDALGIERAVLVGCSMGGANCVDVALAAPERVAGLVLFCSGLSGHVWPEGMQEYVREHVRPVVPASSLAAYAAGEPVLESDARAMAVAHGRLFVAGPARDPSTVDAAAWDRSMDMATGVFRRLWSAPPATEEEPDPPGVARLAEVRAPTLVVNGLSDAPWVQEVSARIAAEVPGARRVDLADTGHLPPVERPAVSARLIAEFAAS